MSANEGGRTGLWPTEVAERYGIEPTSDAPGQCVGIIALGGGYLPEDVKTAATAMGRPTPLVVDCPVNGVNNAFGGGTPFDVELALDLQIVAGLVPSARIAVYFAPNHINSLAEVVRQAISDTENRPRVLSISWGSAEKFWTGPARDAVESAFAEASNLGISIVAAVGDALATAELEDGLAHVLFPASSPLVLACGGTQFDSSREMIWNEIVEGTGGGISDIFDVPEYQKIVDLPVSFNDKKTRRGIPDVSAAAGRTPGYNIVLNDRVLTKEGTSAGAPLWAALIAMANATRGVPAGLIHPHLYKHPELCRQIVEGNNRKDGIGYDAGPGWNACSGLGVPHAGTVEGLVAMPVNTRESLHAT
jgi:kumamolisin